MQNDAIRELGTQQISHTINTAQGLHCLFKSDQLVDDMSSTVFVTRNCSLSYINTEKYIQLLFSRPEERQGG